MTEAHNPLDAFARESDFIVPPRHAAHTPLAHDFQFVFDRAPMPLPRVQEARGHWWLVLTLFALLATAAVGAYLYYPSRALDLDAIAAWASRLTTPPERAMMAPATAPIEARPNNDPTPPDPVLPAKESAVVSEIAGPPVARPDNTATSASLVSPLRNLSGEWRLDTQTEASDSTLESVKLHFTMTLKQDGNRVAGVGTKVSEDAQTPVTMTGNIAGDRLTLNVIDVGTQPETRGKIVLLIDDAATMRGRFSSSAAPTSGHVQAHRVSSAQ